MKRSEALKLRSIIEEAASWLDDKLASEAVTLFCALKSDGSMIQYGSRINWHGTIKRAKVDMWDTAENTPDAAPALWEDIAYREGHRIIPEVITATGAFAESECGWWKDVLYKSLIPANVYTPDQYQAGWEVVAQ